MPSYPPTSTPLSPTHPVTSSLVPPLPTPTYGPKGTFSVLAITSISAPPHAVLNLIRDTNTWSEWNTFCPSILLSPPSSKSEKQKELLDPSSIPVGNPGWVELGTIGAIDVFMSGDGLVPGSKRSRVQGMIVTILEPISPSSSHPTSQTGYRLAWKGTGYSHWQLHSERVMEFIEVELDGGGKGTEFRCWETFGGVLGAVVKATVGGTLVERFGDYQRDVKNFLERNGGKGDVVVVST